MKRRGRGRTINPDAVGKGTTNRHGIFIIMYSTTPVSSSASSGALFVTESQQSLVTSMFPAPCTTQYQWHYYYPSSAAKMNYNHSTLWHPHAVHTINNPSLDYQGRVCLPPLVTLIHRPNLISITLVRRRPAINQTSATNGAPLLIPYGHHYDDNSYQIMLLRHVQFDHRPPAQ